MAKRSVRANVQALEAIRLQRGLTLEDFAETCGLSGRTMDNVMAGEKVLVSTLARIADKLGVNVADISEAVGQKHNGPASSPDTEAKLDEPAPSAGQVAILLDASKAKPADGFRRVKVTVSTIEFDCVDHNELSELVTKIAQAIGAQGQITVTNIQPGSIIITLEISEQDLERLGHAFRRGALDSLGVTRIQVQLLYKPQGKVRKWKGTRHKRPSKPKKPGGKNKIGDGE